MQTMKFAEKQEKLKIYELGEGKRDVVICLNEKEVEEENPETGEKTKAYEYDGNIFRTYALTAEEITEDPEAYIDYPGDEPPTGEMVEYANSKIDEYTAQLMEEGLI